MMSQVEPGIAMYNRRGVDCLSCDLYGCLILSVLVFTLVPALALSQVSPSVFINEFHYDNQGRDRDEGEAIEGAGLVGTHLSGWRLVLYNSMDQKGYDECQLQGTILDQQGNFGTLIFDLSQTGLQNGSRDGIALVDASHQLIPLLSYEGTLVATGGPAAGLHSVEIGVRERSGTRAGESLQLRETGRHYPADPTLRVNHSGTSGTTLGKPCTLLEWHETNPPDEWELRCNDRIHSK